MTVRLTKADKTLQTEHFDFKCVIVPQRGTLSNELQAYGMVPLGQ